MHEWLEKQDESEIDILSCPSCLRSRSGLSCKKVYAGLKDSCQRAEINYRRGGGLFEAGEPFGAAFFEHVVEEGDR